MADEKTNPLLSQKVADQIREMIIQDILPPGTRLREGMLIDLIGKEMDVSRTPLRDALKVLSSEGLVHLLPHRGAVVANPTKDEIRQMQIVLATLEGLAGELAAVLASDEEINEITARHHEMIAAFHRGDRLSYFRCNQLIHIGIVESSRNTTLREIHSRLNHQLYRVGFQFNLRSHGWHDAIREHEAILEALRARRQKELGDLLRMHFGSSFDDFEAPTGVGASDQPSL